MKICQLCAVDFTLFHFLLPLFRGLRAAGHEVVGVCADGPLAAKVRGEGFRVEPMPFVRGYDPRDHVRAFRRTVELFRRERFDLVHVHTPIASLIGRFAAARAGVPKVVYTAHGFYFHEHMPWPKRSAFMALEWIGGRFTDTLFTQAEEDAATARRYALCRTGDVLAIGNGSDPARFFPAGRDDADRVALRRSLDVDEATPVIAVVGRLVAEKGYPELFEAMRSVNARLWVIGERLKSDHAQDIDRAIDAAQSDTTLRARIQFLGYRADVPALLRASDIFVLPSHREGMPRSIIEAMLSGLPVVATNIRGAREEVIEGVTGTLVPVRHAGTLADALMRLAGDAALRRRLGEAGLVRARDLYVEEKVVHRQLEHLHLLPDTAMADTPTAVKAAV
ncbi:MAG TPA: glycosyltransferase family 4 protein [Alphaproteobacteria bacterium]|nr:glycosyltransferase family 4 protein [Alphaproteobacteria bacterium]